MPLRNSDICLYTRPHHPDAEPLQQTTMGAEPLQSTFTALISPDIISQQTALSPAFSTVNPSTTTIKMEDLQTFYQPSPSPETPSHASTDSKSDSKPAKKRKSWGQVLPEPKTNLPPRKRAKTEDEKEQRRIERVKRNRLAAHNSRERKRQEVEQLQSEKEALERSMMAMREQMNRMAAELKEFRKRHPDSLPESNVTAPIEDYDILLQSDTICPRQASFPSPESMDSMDTPQESSSQPSTPAYSETAAIEADQTQHPAAMLCDLQCQSVSPRLSTTSPSFQMSMAFLILFNLQISMMRILSTTFSTLASSLTPPSLASWTPRRTFSTRRSWRRTTSSTRTASVIKLARSTSICRQTQAQQILLATRLASQLKFSAGAAQRSNGLGGEAALERDEWRRYVRQQRLRISRHRGDLSLKQDIKRSCVALNNCFEKPHRRRKYHKGL